MIRSTLMMVLLLWTGIACVRGNLSKNRCPDGWSFCFSFTPKGEREPKTGGQGVETTHTHDARGNVHTETRSRTDAGGNPVPQTWRRFYDARGNLAKTMYADGTSETTTYDGEGNQLTATDRAGRITLFEYDALNRLVKTRFPDGRETSQIYDVAGRVSQVVDQRGNANAYQYDLADNRTKVIDAMGGESQFAYDHNGNLNTFTDALGQITRYDYDAKNRRTRTIFHDGTRISAAYDALDRRTAETDQAGIITSFEYGPNGNLAKVTDALGGETSYGYDEEGNQTSQLDSLGRETNWSFDSAGRAISRTDFNGDTIAYLYDEENRLTEKQLSDSATVQFSYTPTGRRETLTDARGTTCISYDALDRLIRQDNPDGTWLAYEYDAKGNQTALETARGRTTFEYDALDRLIRVIAPDGRVTTYQYDAVGNRVGLNHPNGTQTSYVYEELNRLLYLENRRSDGSIISSYAYTLGPSGNRLAVDEKGGRRVEYAYDALHRLLEERIIDPVNGNQTINYTLDAVGNRQSKTDASATISYSYDTNDRLQTAGGDTYTYDNNGNTVTATVNGQLTSYQYDGENRLIGAETPTASLAYGYNADGIRVSSEVNAQRTVYLVDENRQYAEVLEENDANGNLIASYLHADDLISQTRGGITHYYHHDGHGSVTALTDATEVVTDRYQYDAWGILLTSAETTSNSYRYAGEAFDIGLGMFYLRARFYKTSVGRFHTFDPWPGWNADPFSLHKYLYGRGDPVNGLDPSGYFTLNEVTSLSAIFGFLSGITVPNLLFDEADGSFGERFGKCLFRFGGQYALMVVGVAVGVDWGGEPIPKTPWELSRTAGGKKFTTRLSRFNLRFNSWLKNVSGKRGTTKIFRNFGRRLASLRYVVRPVGGAAVGYVLGLLPGCLIAALR